METLAGTDHIEMRKTRRVKESLVAEKAPKRGSTQHFLYNTLCVEGSEDFYSYLDWLDLAGTEGALVLSRDKHFYYSSEDFLEIELLINLKCLNSVSDLNSFLGTIYNNMNDYCYFTGCFQDSKIVEEEIPGYVKYLEDFEKSRTKVKNNNSALSWFSEKFGRLFKTDANNTLNRDITRKMLKITGFTVLDMTELNGKTYYCVQKRPALD